MSQGSYSFVCTVESFLVAPWMTSSFSHTVKYKAFGADVLTKSMNSTEYLESEVFGLSVERKNNKILTHLSGNPPFSMFFVFLCVNGKYC